VLFFSLLTGAVLTFGAALRAGVLLARKRKASSLRSLTMPVGESDTSA
jgi:hypothetical protein